MAGLLHSKTPYQLYKPKYFFTGPDFYEITSAVDYSFAWGASIAVRHNFGRCYQLGISMEYLAAKASFDFDSTSGFRQDIKRIAMLNLGLVFSVYLF